MEKWTIAVCLKVSLEQYPPRPPDIGDGHARHQVARGHLDHVSNGHRHHRMVTVASINIGACRAGWLATSNIVPVGTMSRERERM